MVTVAGLYCYPVKSCGGVALNEATLDVRGILHDREFLVVDAADRFLTQRASPELARVVPELTPDALVLRYAAAGELRIPWEPPAGDPAPRSRGVTVWNDTLLADDQGEAAAAWFKAVLGHPCRLVRINSTSDRPLAAARVPGGFPAASPRQVAFPDVAPLLVLSEESLAGLNARLAGTPLPMDRFRPNIVLTGCARPHEEDEWKVYELGETTLWSIGACARCAIVTIDQRTLARAKEPLRTLGTYRRAQDGNAVVFGQHVIHARPGGRFRLNDTVRVLV